MVPKRWTILFGNAPLTPCLPSLTMFRRPGLHTILLIILHCSCTLIALAAEPPPPSPDLFRGYTPAEFRQLSAAQQEIDPASLREELLSAAIFHETNKRRADEKLPVLAVDEKVRAASVQHAQAMAKHSTLSHGTPWNSSSSTAYDRLVAQGLQPRFSAENIAFNFALRYESGKPFYTREESGRAIFSYEPEGAPLPRHTYASFAEAILSQWMKSPGHRKNIVAPEAEFLGVGCAVARDGNGFDTIYADQDFFAPLPAPPSPARP